MHIFYLCLLHKLTTNQISARSLQKQRFQNFHFDEVIFRKKCRKKNFGAKIEKMKKTSGGIHLKNMCTKFEVNPNISKMSKFRGTVVIERGTEGWTIRKPNALRLSGCIKTIQK